MTKLIGLGKWDEEEITKKLRAEALVKCDEAVREYAECCRSHWFVWKCKSLAHKMNDCVRQYTTTEDFDRLRIEYLKSHNKL